VKHRVTIGTDWAQIRDRVHLVLTTNLGQWNQVMDVDEILELDAVARSEIHFANIAPMSPMSETGYSSASISFEPVYSHLAARSFNVLDLLVELVGHETRVVVELAYEPFQRGNLLLGKSSPGGLTEPGD
jgi:hypothetical protein